MIIPNSNIANPEAQRAVSEISAAMEKFRADILDKLISPIENVSTIYLLDPILLKNEGEYRIPENDNNTRHFHWRGQHLFTERQNPSPFAEPELLLSVELPAVGENPPMVIGEFKLSNFKTN